MQCSMQVWKSICRWDGKNIKTKNHWAYTSSQECWLQQWNSSTCMVITKYGINGLMLKLYAGKNSGLGWNGRLKKNLPIKAQDINLSDINVRDRHQCTCTCWHIHWHKLESTFLLYLLLNVTHICSFNFLDHFSHSIILPCNRAWK